MDRRDFMAAAGFLASAATLTADEKKEVGVREYYEWVHYRLPPGPAKKQRFMNYLKDAKLPALNRLGIGPIGVFDVLFGPNEPSVHLLLPHPSLESVATAIPRIFEDSKFQEAGKDIIDAKLSDPVFLRAERTVMHAFTHLPKLEVPPQQANNQPRIFELRVYESHSMKAAVKKVEMFNEGGEIAIFKKTGLRPVFFGSTIIGPAMPNLTYMLAFSDMAERDKAWQTFRADPEWKDLSGKSEYADTVSNIVDYILRPAPFSQI